MEEEKVVEQEQQPEKEPNNEIAKLQEEIQRLKQAQSNASADASEWKKKYRATQSESERTAAEAAEQLKNITDELAEYKTRERVSGYQAKLMSVGYDTETASEMAAILPPDIPDAFFDSQKLFLDAREKTIKAEALKQQPALTPGIAPSSQNTIDQETAKLRRWAGLN